MKLRIRIPGLDAAARHDLERTARLFLGRHAQAIESVAISLRERARGAAEHTECEVVLTLRDGGSLRVHDDGSQVQRALRRAAWRVDARRGRSRIDESGAERRLF